MFVSLYFRTLKYESIFLRSRGISIDIVVKAGHHRIKEIETEPDCIKAIKAALIKDHERYLWKLGSKRGYVIKVENYPGEKGQYFKKPVEVLI